MVSAIGTVVPLIFVEVERRVDQTGQANFWRSALSEAGTAWWPSKCFFEEVGGAEMRFSLWFSVVAVVLSGCGGSQSQIAPLGALPGSVTTASHPQATSRSRVLPGSSGDLIYAVGGCGGTCVVSYPDGVLVGTLATSGLGVCSDNQGNVFISNDTQVVEYAHGGTTPVATLDLPGNMAVGCSVDPTTNNLAIVFRGSGGDIAIFLNEGGSPTLYASGIDSFYCGYDAYGNLFVDGFTDKSGPQPALAEMTNGGTSFNPLTISPYIGQPGQVQWDGKYMTYETVDTGKIKRLSISGSNVTVEGTTSLRKVTRGAGASWIHGDSVIVPFPLHGARNKTIGIWGYPKGGKATRLIKRFGDYNPGSIHFQGVTLSVKPS
jgi:hypothetical protein